MRKTILISAILCMAAGCATSSSSSGAQKESDISEAQVPKEVQAAFDSEHPYAQMNHPKTYSDCNGDTVYEIPYTRQDGSTGTAKYGSMGELMFDLQKD
jgi:hypothetical protein